MALYTAAEVFNWSTTGYNALYTTSHTATFNDDDGAYEGDGDGDELVSIDGGAFGASGGSPYAIVIPFVDAGGTAHTETFYFFLAGGSWYFIPGPGSAFTVGATLGSYSSHTTGWNYTDVICFCIGTMIETDHGQIAVEALQTGDRVKTADGSYKELRLSFRRKVSAAELFATPKLYPVRITAEALGGGLPKRDLWLSRQHRMLTSSPVAKRMFGEAEVLVAAIMLTDLPGISVDTDIEHVEYFHLVFDQHETIYAEGALSESLYIGAEAVKTLSPEALEELVAIFPEVLGMESPCPAYQIPIGKLQKQFVARLVKNNKTLVS